MDLVDDDDSACVHECVRICYVKCLSAISIGFLHPSAHINWMYYVMCVLSIYRIQRSISVVSMPYYAPINEASGGKLIGQS